MRAAHVLIASGCALCLPQIITTAPYQPAVLLGILFWLAGGLLLTDLPRNGARNGDLGD